MKHSHGLNLKGPVVQFPVSADERKWDYIKAGLRVRYEFQRAFKVLVHDFFIPKPQVIDWRLVIHLFKV